MSFDVIIGRAKKAVEKYGKAGTVLLGRQYIKMGQVTSLSNPVYLDVAGAHVAFIVGKRGSGKCVHPDTKVATGNSHLAIQQIFEILKADAQAIITTATEEHFRVSRAFSVLSLTPDLAVLPRNLTYIYRKFVQEPLRKITTQLGNVLYASKEHPLLMHTPVKEGNSYQIQLLWQRCDELKADDTIVIYEDEHVRPDIIQSIEDVQYQGWVYDLTVDDTHNFIGNSIVCHNSYTMGSIAEGLADLPLDIRQNLSIILLDTMGIYWTMKYPNFQDAELLKQWGFEPKGLDVKIYTPTGFFYIYKNEGIPTDVPFSIRPKDVGADDWCTAFGMNPNSAEGVLLTRAVQQRQGDENSYPLESLISTVQADQESDPVVRHVIVNELKKAQDWGIFSPEGTPLSDLVAPGQVTILDMSPYATVSSGWEIKALVVGLICRSLFTQRLLARKAEEFKTVDAAMHYFSKDVQEKMEEPLVWLALDEAHELLPKEGKTAATDALITILREGRQPGISLILASQQPGKIHTDVMTQADIVIAHRITARMDVEALSLLTQSYMRQGLEREVDNLPRVMGAAVVFDDANERLFPLQMRPRLTWHGGGSPLAISEKKEFARKGLERLKEL